MSDPLPNPENGSWSPRIVAFFCNWCTYTAADLAGVSRLKYAANVRVIRLMCSGRVDPQFILEALRRGADGVLIGGCHPGDCHYIEGNYKMLRRFRLLKRMLRDLGIDERRVRLEWISAAEGEKVKGVINEMTAQIKELGPLGLPRKFAEWDEEIIALARGFKDLEGEAPAEPIIPASREVAHA
jgi:F420-non-reducing hydrogenase iron-sulfur subunit